MNDFPSFQVFDLLLSADGVMTSFAHALIAWALVACFVLAFYFMGGRDE